MNFLRKAIVVTLCTLLPMVLISFGVLFSIYQVLGSPAHIKNALEESKIYDAATASLLKQTTNQEGRANTQTPGGEEAIRQAIIQAVPPSYLEQQTGNILDGIYSWLQGDTQNLSFTVDLTPVKNSLVESLTKQAKERAATLPPCTPENLATIGDDPFSMGCLPAGVTPDQLADKTKQSMLESEIFKNASITPQTLLEGGGKPLEKQLVSVRDGFQAVKKGVYISGFLAILFTATIIFASRPRQTGAKRIAYALLTVGGMGIITSIVGSFAIKAIADSITKKAGDTLSVRAAEAVSLLANDVRVWWLILGVVSVVVALGTIVGIRIWDKKHPVKPAPGKSPAKQPDPSNKITS